MQYVDRDGVSIEAIEALRRTLKGEVFARGDEGYDLARASWNLTIDHRPELVVVVASEADVVEAVRFANRENFAICVQATGHGQPRVCEGELLLVVGNLNEVRIDAEARTARIGGGTKWGKVIEEATRRGLVPISGSALTVGVVGYTVGGGYGLLSRKHGLAADVVTSFRIVTPDGEPREATPEANGELYWAVLGGGGAYGVVTEITMGLFPEEPMFGGSVMFDASLAANVYSAYLRWTKTLPDEVGSVLSMVKFPPVPAIPEFLQGRAMLVLAASVLAEPSEAETLLAPMRSLAGAEFDSFRAMAYAESPEIFRDPSDPTPSAGRGVLLHDLDEAGIEKLLAAIGPVAESPSLAIQLRHLEGAIGRPGSSPNATGDRRRAKYGLYFIGNPNVETPERLESQAENVFTGIGSYVLSRGPLNFVGEVTATRAKIRDAFDEGELVRLDTLKKSLDPNNRFRFAGVGIAD